MRSMTGFGRAEEAGLNVEIKSYNGRFLDMFVTLPRELSSLEPYSRAALSERCSRGKVETTCRYKKPGSADFTIDEEALRIFSQSIREITAVVGSAPAYGLNDLVMADVFGESDEGESLPTLYKRVFEAALLEFIRFRETEGSRLRDDMVGQLFLIYEQVEAIEARAPGIDLELRTRLRARFKEVMGDDVEERRLLEETAAWAIRIDINEEIVRIKSHIDEMKALLTGEAAAGRKLDFLCQELNREINTIGSKIADIEVKKHGIEMKEAVEKIKEQARNVE